MSFLGIVLVHVYSPRATHTESFLHGTRPNTTTALVRLHWCIDDQLMAISCEMIDNPSCSGQQHTHTTVPLKLMSPLTFARPTIKVLLLWQRFNSPSASSPVKKSSSQDSQYYYYCYYTFYPFTGTHDAYRTRGTREKDVATYFIQWLFAKSSGVAEENTEERWKTLLKVGAQRMSCSLISLLSLRVHCEDERLVKVADWSLSPRVWNVVGQQQWKEAVFCWRIRRSTRKVLEIYCTELCIPRIG